MKKLILIPVGVVLVALAFLFLRDGGSGGTASPGDLAGSWSSARGAQLTLREDGTLSAVNVPTDFSVGENTPIDLFTGGGVWSLEERKGRGDQEIRLSLAQADGHRMGIRLLVAGKGARNGIYLPIDQDAGTKYTFRKSS